MEGYGNFNDGSGFYPNDGGDLVGDGSARDDDPNDDFDPLELLNSPLFGENGRGSVTGGGGESDFGGGIPEQQQQQLPQVPNLDGSHRSQQGGMDNSQVSHGSQQQQNPNYGTRDSYGGPPNSFGGGGMSGPLRISSLRW